MRDLVCEERERRGEREERDACEAGVREAYCSSAEDDWSGICLCVCVYEGCVSVEQTGMKNDPIPQRSVPLIRPLRMRGKERERREERERDRRERGERGVECVPHTNRYLGVCV